MQCIARSMVRSHYGKQDTTKINWKMALAGKFEVDTDMDVSTGTLDVYIVPDCQLVMQSTVL